MLYDLDDFAEDFDLFWAHLQRSNYQAPNWFAPKWTLASVIGENAMDEKAAAELDVDALFE